MALSVAKPINPEPPAAPSNDLMRFAELTASYGARHVARAQAPRRMALSAAKPINPECPAAPYNDLMRFAELTASYGARRVARTQTRSPGFSPGMVLAVPD